MNRIKKHFEKELKESNLMGEVENLNRYVGDIHNHCAISYGYGSIEHAIAFAKAQLDFFSVTGHFAWPDIEKDSSMKIPGDVVDYHKKGFEKLRKEWPHYKACMKDAESDTLIPFLSYEYHSFYYGDYTVVCKNLDEDLPERVEEGKEDLRLKNLIEGESSQKERFLPIPHHIGYKKGYRGINFDEFNENVSPLIEIISMHGCAESPEARIGYMHTMGPRSSTNTYQGGLKRGLHFGVTGSTDHHNAAPGSYGFGRTLLWAESLSRDNVWSSFNDRNTIALSGDPIEAFLFVNGKRHGKKAKKKDELEVEAFVSAYDKLDKVEIIQGDRVILSKYDFEGDNSYSGTVGFMFGWGKKHKEAVWDVKLTVENATVNALSPRFRGIDMVDPLDIPKNPESNLPSLEKDKNEITLHLVSDGNINAVTNSTQGFILDLDGSRDTKLRLSLSVSWDGRVTEKEYLYTLDDLRGKNDTEYVDGFVSPSFQVGEFRTTGEITCHIKGRVKTDSKDGVYLRVYQKNGDCAFTSPVSLE